MSAKDKIEISADIVMKLLTNSQDNFDIQLENVLLALGKIYDKIDNLVEIDNESNNNYNYDEKSIV